MGGSLWGERGGRYGQDELRRGPSTAQLAKNASCSTQDDSVKQTTAKNRQQQMRGFFAALRMTSKNRQQRNTEILPFDYAQGRMTTHGGFAARGARI